jgi:uncharacterized protein (TIGR02996 family)
MVDEQGFVQAILANLTDDGPRLVYADWLEERGDPRGEFLRIQTALTRMPRKDQQQAPFRKRLKELRSTIGSDALAWFNALRYRTVFAALARPLTRKDGFPEKRVAQGERRLGIRLPRALRDYYLLAGRLDRFNQAHDHLVPPEEWELASGKVAFLVENQGVWQCSVKLDDRAGDDPSVVGQYLDSRDRWREPEPCSAFLVTHLYYQAVYGNDAMDYLGVANVTARELAILEKTWPFIGQSTNLRAFGRNGQAVCVLEGALELYVGGRSRRDFDALVAEFAGIGVAIESR